MEAKINISKRQLRNTLCSMVVSDALVGLSNFFVPCEVIDGNYAWMKDDNFKTEEFFDTPVDYMKTNVYKGGCKLEIGINYPMQHFYINGN